MDGKDAGQDTHELVVLPHVLQENGAGFQWYVLPFLTPGVLHGWAEVIEDTVVQSDTEDSASFVADSLW